MAGASFLDLPLEVRQMIYMFLIDGTSRRLITSPIRKRRDRSPIKGNAALFLASRAIYADFAYLHYSKNRFVVGNGLLNSTTEANAHGFTSFLSRVPRHHVNYITRLQINISAHCWYKLSTPRVRLIPYDLFSYTDMELSAFQNFAIMISKRFLGTQEIRLYFRCELGERSIIDSDYLCM
jgi:hypothetical protein